jgi:hypothetical protein
MSGDLDWARLEAMVERAVERLRAAAAENASLRAEVTRLEAELESSRASAPRAGDGNAVAVRDQRTEEVRQRLARLEGELESLLG